MSVRQEVGIKKRILVIEINGCYILSKNYAQFKIVKESIQWCY